MAIALVAETEFHTASSSAFACTPVTANVGEIIVVVAHLRTGAATDSSSCADSAGNTYTYQAVDTLTSTNSRICIFTAPVLTALSAGTITVSAAAAYAMTVDVTRWSGAAQVEKVAHKNQVATTTPTAATVAVAEASAAIIGGVSYGSATAPTLNAPNGFTALTGNSPNTGFYGANAYRIPGASGTYGPDWTIPSAGSASATVALTPGSFNYLNDPGFEFDTNADGLTDSWTDEHTTATKPTYTRTTSNVTDGANAQRMQYTGEGTNTGTQVIEIYQATPLGTFAAGDPATFTVYLSGTITGTYGYIGVEAFNSSHTYLGEVDLTTTLTGTPQQFTLTYPSLPPGTSYAAVFFQSPTQTTSSTVDVTLDAATLTKTAAGLATGAAVTPSATITTSGSTGLATGSAEAVTVGLIATGTVTAAVSSTATLTPSVTVTTAGQVGTSTTTTTAVSVSITAAGRVGAQTTATVTATITTTTTGTVVLTGSASQTVTVNIAAAGVVGIASAAVLVIAASVSAVGPPQIVTEGVMVSGTRPTATASAGIRTAATMTKG